MKPVLFIFILMCFFGCGGYQNSSAPEITADSAYLKFSGLNADMTCVLDSALIIELKKTERLNSYYDVFISEFSFCKIFGHHFTERFDTSARQISEILKDENDILILRECLYSKNATEKSKNFSEDFLKIYFLREKTLESDTTLNELKNINCYLSKSTYFRNVTENDTVKIRNLIKLVYLSLLKVPEEFLKNAFVQNLFDFKFLGIAECTTQLGGLYALLQEKQNFNYDFLRHWAEADKNFLISQKHNLELFFGDGKSVVFYDKNTLAVYGLKVEFGKTLSVKIKKFNPQFIDFEKYGRIFNTDTFPLKEIRFAKLCRGIIHSETIFQDSTTEEFFNGDFGYFKYFFINGDKNLR